MARDHAKAIVLSIVAAGVPVTQASRALYLIGQTRLHVRFRSLDPRKPGKFLFGLNATSLSADHELWICGDPETFYLLDHATVVSIYEHPNAYPDHRHPAIRVATVDVARHEAAFARDGERVDLRGFLNRTLAI